MAKRFANPIAAFVSDLVVKRPGECIVEEVVVFIKENASLITGPVTHVADAETYFGDYNNNKKLYYSYQNPDAAIYGLPDLFYATSPYMAVYYCEHRDLRKQQLSKATIKDEKVFLAEGLLLLQSALYFCENGNGIKGLFSWACNLKMLSYLQPFILNSNEKYPLLEIADITALSYVHDYLQKNGFTEIPLTQTQLKARVYSKCIVEADGTVLLFLGWG